MHSRFLLLIVFCPGATSAALACSRSSTQRAVDGSNLRQIGQAAIIYSTNNRDRLPEANDVWDYARLLAERGGLTDSELWLSRIDPAYESGKDREILSGANANQSRRINPDFLKLKPAYAVALGKIRTSSPSATPIAWTRGLQPDGTWAKHSPYGDAGGFILFISGQISFYTDLKQDGGQLTRYDGSGRTANILEALPPGTRIGEYTPTPEEQAAWSAQPRPRFTPSTSIRRWFLPHTVIIGIVFLPFVIIAVKRLIQKRRLTLGLLLWPVFIGVVFAIIIPTSC